MHGFCNSFMIFYLFIELFVHFHSSCKDEALIFRNNIRKYLQHAPQTLISDGHVAGLIGDVAMINHPCMKNYFVSCSPTQVSSALLLGKIQTILTETGELCILLIVNTPLEYCLTTSDKENPDVHWKNLMFLFTCIVKL